MSCFSVDLRFRNDLKVVWNNNQSTGPEMRVGLGGRSIGSELRVRRRGEWTQERSSRVCTNDKIPPKPEEGQWVRKF